MAGEVKEISITYIPRHKYTLDNTYDQRSIILRQAFLDTVEEDFLQIMLSDMVGDRIPNHVIDAILAYSDQHNLDKDVTVVFDYS
jgi:hypothetical protein